MEDSCDDHLFEKPSHPRRPRGTRNGRKEEQAKRLKNVEMIAKTIHDETYTVSKRSKAKMVENCEDSFGLDVMYSMKKKKRWEMSPEDIIEDGLLNEIPVSAVERDIGKGACGYLNCEQVIAVHSKDADGCVRTAKSLGRGQSLSNFLPKNREESGKKVEKVQKPELHYNFLKQRLNELALPGEKRFIGYPYEVEKVRAKWKLVDPDDVDEPMTSSNEDDAMGDCDSDENLQKEVRRLKIEHCFIEKSKRERKSRRKESEIDFSEVEIIEKEVATFSNVANYPETSSPAYVFLTTIFNLSKLNFEQNVKRNGFLSMFPRRLIFPSRKATESLLYVIIEEVVFRRVKVLINSSIPANPLKNTEKNFYKLLDGSEDFLDIVKRLVKFFHSSLCNSRKMKEESNMDEISFEKMIIDEKEWEMIEKRYKPINSPFFREGRTLGCTAILKFKNGALQQWSDVQDFTRSNGFLQEYEFLENSSFEGNNLACNSCHSTQGSQVFKMSDGFFECANCLESHILRQIRIGDFPIDLKLDIEEEGTSYDLLPEIVSLTVFNTITKAVFKQNSRAYQDICPFCDAFLRLEDDYEAVCCDSCQQCWCKYCKLEPHWPMNCQQYLIWKPKWDLQFAVEHSQGSGEMENLLEVFCPCSHATYQVVISQKMKFYGKMIRVIPYLYQIINEGTCPHCELRLDKDSLIEIVDKTKRNVGKWYRFDVPPARQLIWNGKEYVALPLRARLLEVKSTIRRDVREPCLIARKARNDRKNYEKLTKKTRDLRKIDSNAPDLGDLHQKAQLLIENVNGYLYTTNKFTIKIRKILKNIGVDCLEMVQDELDSVSTLQIAQRIEESIQRLVSMVEKIVRNGDNL
ncbi:unnamed protein product [Caenorhabditis auriculariae]|uniref:IBR domain-containing protein n=1 Tax=Caenorhabditis auriculariae TaxID=2777116 RepID=A0A8S1HSY2_9PELO|nr:unnamed protein product [Caenorhabditis auriculariae]